MRGTNNAGVEYKLNIENLYDYQKEKFLDVLKNEKYNISNEDLIFTEIMTKWSVISSENTDVDIIKKAEFEDLNEEYINQEVGRITIFTNDSNNKPVTVMLSLYGEDEDNNYFRMFKRDGHRRDKHKHMESRNTNESEYNTKLMYAYPIDNINNTEDRWDHVCVEVKIKKKI